MAMLIFFVLINKKMPSLKVTIIYIELLSFAATSWCEINYSFLDILSQISRYGYITPNRATRISQTMPLERVPIADFVSVKPCH